MVLCRRVGMADEADSKSVVGNHVRVQVPLPAVVGNSCKLKGSLIEPMVYSYFFSLSYYPMLCRIRCNNKNFCQRFPWGWQPPLCWLWHFGHTTIHINLFTTMLAKLFPHNRSTVWAAYSFVRYFPAAFRTAYHHSKFPLFFIYLLKLVQFNRCALHIQFSAHFPCKNHFH